MASARARPGGTPRCAGAASCAVRVRRHSRLASDPVQVSPLPMLRPSSAASTAVVPERGEDRDDQQGGREVGQQVGQHGRDHRDQHDPAQRHRVGDAGRSTASPRKPTPSPATTTPSASTQIAKPGWAERTRSRSPEQAVPVAPDAEHDRRHRRDPPRLAAERRHDREADQHQADDDHREGRDGGAGPTGRVAGRRSGRGGTAAAARRTRRRGPPRAPAPSASAKPVNVRSRSGIASRLVRLETGSRSEAELAIRRQA